MSLPRTMNARSLVFLQRDPAFDFLHGDARFCELANRMGSSSPVSDTLVDADSHHVV